MAEPESRTMTLKAKAAICEALGLDISRLYSLTLTLNGKEAPKVTAEMFVFDSTMHKLAQVLKEFELVEKL
jgi:hypothetical protein